MTSDKVLIDPLSFFSSGGPKIIEQQKPSQPSTAAVQKRELEKENIHQEVKKVRTTDMMTTAKMPGVRATQQQASAAKPHLVAELWVEKYKPKKLNDLVGNSIPISKLEKWLKNWNYNTPVQSVRPGQDFLTARAALLSGPPGLGKTSSAKLVCESLGYSVLEFNASDTRSKQAIDDLASGLSTNKVLFGNDGGRSMGSRVAVIMDECDGMSAGDRGGSAALIQLIKKSKLPIICVCNDRQDSKIRSLANHCYDLRFMKPTPEEVAARAVIVSQKEN